MQPSQEGCHHQPKLWWLLQVRAFTSGSFLTRPCLWAGEAVGGKGVLKPHLAVSPLSLFPTLSPAVPTLGSRPSFPSGSGCNLTFLSLLSRVAATVSTFWWASQTVARLLSTELSLFPFWGMLLLAGMGGSSGWGLTMAVDAFSLFCPWWSLREDSTSSSSDWFPRRRPGESLQLVNLQV